MKRVRPTQPRALYSAFSRRHVACALLCVVSCIFVSFNHQTFVGLTALLAAFPPCLGYDEPAEPTQPLLSGSVCRVRDSLDFLDPVPRAKVTLLKRLAIAKDEFSVGPTCHINNGDEENVPLFAGQFHKTLPHDKFGQVDEDAYKKLQECIFTSDINVCDDVPSGAKKNGAKLTNPLGGTAHQVAGADSDNIFIPTPDSLLSERLAAQQSEVYWMALARDIPFGEFATNDLIRLAAENLQGLPAFKGLNIPRSKGGKIDPVTDLFRTTWPGVTTGPVVSQFMLSDFLIDSINVTPKADPLTPFTDYMTSFQPWLDVQNGASDVDTTFDSENPRFIRNGRDLATISFRDLLYTEAFRAALILFTQGALGGSIGPYEEAERQQGFATFGAPHILTAMGSASSSTRHAWYQKWQVHRMLRPEAYGGLVHNTLMKNVITPLPDSILRNTELLNRVEVHNQKMNGDGEKTFLLPMASAQGSPTHPAYPSGHAINVGAYITSLKAFLGFEAGQRCFPDPVVSNNEGTERIPYVPSGREIVGECINDKGKKVDGLTYEGELNKVSANVLIGRSHLGVHWRMDGVYGALVGEVSAVRRLQQELPGLAEARPNDDLKRKEIPPATYNFRLYSGKMLELYGANLYKLDGKLCEGAFTGDDFCDEVQEDDYESFEHIVEDLAKFSLHTEL
uniref:Vanadium-dependent bromine peroxidase n=1 Tax=Saccharina japonica TaxID=88149 RepID=A0A3G3BM34_SACJA|nr:vanadium-dependent bromine peroxidase [Saccharina japonica]